MMPTTARGRSSDLPSMRRLQQVPSFLRGKSPLLLLPLPEWMHLEVAADLGADVVQTKTRWLSPWDASLPETGPVGAAKRQGCREMKSEPLRLGLQGRLSFPINNSGFPRGWEDDIISHPFPTATLLFPSLFLVVVLHSSLHAVRGLGTPW